MDADREGCRGRSFYAQLGTGVETLCKAENSKGAPPPRIELKVWLFLGD